MRELLLGALSAAELASLDDHAGDFVLASTNVDEDLHFSSLYFESTLAPPHASWGLSGWFTELVAFNDQAVERYYLKTDECLSIATQLTDLVVANPNLLTDVLHEIEVRSGVLDSIFPFGWMTARRRSRDSNVLAELYRRHLAVHRYLYEVARIPETLDRGHNVFTDRMLEILAARTGDRAEAAEALAILGSDRPSMFRQEQLEFSDLIGGLADHEQTAVRKARTGALALISISAASRRALKDHRTRWAPLFYHGYGHRELIPLSELAGRMRQVLVKGTTTLLPTMASRGDRESLIRRLSLSPEEQALTYAYGLIGWTKARRRWYQLRNFQRLDLLMELLSEDLGCSERELRSLLPVEVLAWIDTGDRPDAAISERADGVVYWAHGRTTRVAPLEVELTFGIPADRGIRHLSGVGLVAGEVRGRCVLGSRGGHPPPDDDLTASAVLVVAQLDSDMVWMLPFYAGLIVEEGGASAHVSIVANEIGIPTISGVVGASRILLNGEEVVMDGTAGTVQRVLGGGKR